MKYVSYIKFFAAEFNKASPAENLKYETPDTLVLYIVRRLFLFISISVILKRMFVQLSMKGLKALLAFLD